jgi:hypothetical protein
VLKDVIIPRMNEIQHLAALPENSNAPRVIDIQSQEAS